MGVVGGVQDAQKVFKSGGCKVKRGSGLWRRDGGGGGAADAESSPELEVVDVPMSNLEVSGALACWMLQLQLQLLSSMPRAVRHCKVIAGVANPRARTPI